MKLTMQWFGAHLNNEWVVHSARTSIAAVVSLLVATLLRMPDAYWAPITAIVVTQSTLGAALAPSWQRFSGTALGAVAGALLATYFGSNLIAFTLGVFLLGLASAVLHLDISGYRFAGTTVTMVMLIPHTTGAWNVAWNRFVEVSIGIAVGLAISAVWPETEVAKRASAT